MDTTNDQSDYIRHLDKNICYICSETSDEPELKQYCNCSLYAHKKCLVKWIESKHKKECEVCLQEYTAEIQQEIENYNITINSTSNNPVLDANDGYNFSLVRYWYNTIVTTIVFSILLYYSIFALRNVDSDEISPWTYYALLSCVILSGIGLLLGVRNVTISYIRYYRLRYG